jgi:hypothetical protein
MKKYIIILFIISALIAIISVQQRRIYNISADRDSYRQNTEILLQDVERYKTRDSLNAVKVGVLELKLSDLKKYRANDIALIKTLQTKNRDLQAITTSQMQTIIELQTNIRDSVIFLPGDTIILRCIDVVDNWFELHGCATSDGQFIGECVSRDSLLITETVKYKRFLGFLWKTKKIKNKEIDVVSKNPHTQIMGVEYIQIKK